MGRSGINKPYICFCVEGINDKRALNGAFQSLFDKKFGDKVLVEFRHASGDITSRKGVEPGSVEKMVWEKYFKAQDKKSGLQWTDLSCLIHIIDIDGIYVKDENIKLFTPEELIFADGLGGADTLYYEDHIAVRDKIENITERNVRKRKNVEHLRRLETIRAGKREVPYALYFFSCNIDHFLFGDANLDINSKSIKAGEFGIRHIDCESFETLLSESNEYCAKCGYDQSWLELIRRNNSLARGTNLNLLVDKILKSSISDWG